MLALVALPVAVWWLALLRSPGAVAPAPLAYLPAALPLLLVARSFASGRVGPAISGFAAGVSILGTTGAGVVFVPVGLGVVVVEAVSREAPLPLLVRALAFLLGYLGALGVALMLQSVAP